MSRSNDKKVIAFVLKGYPRLSETFILNEILLLEELGYPLHIVAMRNPGETKIHGDVERVKAPVSYVPDYFWQFFGAFMLSHLRVLLRYPLSYLPALHFAAWRSLKRWSSSTIKRFSQAVYFVDRVVPDARFGQYYAHFSHGPTTLVFFASWITGIPYSFSAHAKDIYLQEDEFLRQKIHGAQFAVTCTGFNRKHMAGVAGSDAPVYRCYHGINIEKFTRNAALSRNGKPPVILSIGRFVPKKGFPTLLKAMHLLKEKGYAFSAYFAGGGPMADELQTLIDQFGLTANVQLINKLSQEELLDYYRKADIFALACEVQPDGDRDGIPNVLVEAMALEIPAVSTAISGIPELIDDGKNGLLVPQRNPEALAAALEKLINQPELALALGKAGRETVKQEFDNRQNVIKIGTLLDDAMKSPALENRDFRAIVKYS